MILLYRHSLLVRDLIAVAKMANTLTLPEFQEQKKKALANIYEVGKKYLKDLQDGCTACDSGKHLPELILYAKTLESWQQDQFNWEQFTNYLNSNKIQQIFTRINQII